MSTKYDDLLNQSFFKKKIAEQMKFLDKLKDKRVPDVEIRKYPEIMSLYNDMVKSKDYTYYGHINTICRLLSYNDDMSPMKKDGKGGVVAFTRKEFEREFNEIYKKLPKRDIYILGISWYLNGKPYHQQSDVISYEQVFYKRRSVYVGLLNRGDEIASRFYYGLIRFCRKES